MIEIRVPHELARGAASERVRAAAARLDVLPADQEDEHEHGGSLRKDTPLGSVVARWDALEAEVVVQVLSRPAFLPEETVRRLLEEGLREALRE